MYVASSEQQWEPVVVKRPRKSGGAGAGAGSSSGAEPADSRPPPAPHRCNGSGRAHESATPAWKIERRADAEAGRPVDLVGTEAGAAIVRGRVAKGWTQRELAQRVHMLEKAVKDIERGTAVRVGADLAKIRRVLGLGPGAA